MFKYSHILKHRVIDGDSIEVTLDMGFKVSITQVCRVIGVDTPEINTSAGRAVKLAVIDFLRNGPLECDSYKRDKFSDRFVGDLFVNGESLSEWLLSNQYAKPYNGRKKQPWHLEELNRIESKLIQLEPVEVAGIRIN